VSLSFLLTLFILIIPTFGKAIDPQESIILYSSILLFYFFFDKKSKLLPKLSSKFILTQVALIVLLAISTILSKNIGYSYYQFFKFIFVLVTLNLSLTYVSRSSLIKYLLGFSILYSFIFLLEKFQLITIAVKPSSDNFILQIWGHSYLADFIVLAMLPIVFGLVNPAVSFIKNKLAASVLLAFLCIILILTNSRSAMIAVTISSLFIYLPKFKKIYYPIFIIISLSIAGWLINQSFFQTIGVKSWDGSRPEYWLQATKAFINSPLSGQGPGNFFYINKKYQSYPNSDTNYAHNSFFESLSLNGFPYTLIFFSLIIFGLIYKYRLNRLDFAIGLTSLFNSLLDPSWNSFGILVLTLFFIFNQNPNLINPPSKNNPKILQKYFPPIIICLCLIFFISKTASDLLFNFKEYQKSILIDPFNNNPRLAILPQNLDTTITFYANDFHLYQQLINLIPLPQAEIYYLKLIDLDPLSHLPEIIKLNEFYQQSSQYQKQLNMSLLVLNRFPTQIPTQKFYSSVSLMFYHTAINNYHTHPQESIELMEKAVTVYPGLSHLYIELTNLYSFTNQTQAAKSILTETCFQYPFATPHCQEYLEQSKTKGYLLPGSTYFRDFISDYLSSPTISTPKSDSPLSF